MLLTESLVKMGKWSEGDQWEVDRDGAREESEDVILFPGVPRMVGLGG